MPEGHVLHRAARLQGRRFRNERCGRRHRGDARRRAATLNGQTITGIGALGKHLFYRFDEGDILHVHLGLFGKFGFGRYRHDRAWHSARHGDRDRSSPRRPDGVRAHHPRGRGRSPRSTRSGPDPRSHRWNDELGRRLNRRSISIRPPCSTRRWSPGSATCTGPAVVPCRDPSIDRREVPRALGHRRHLASVGGRIRTARRWARS